MGREEFTELERRDGAMRWRGCTELCEALTVGCPSLKRLGLGGHLIGGRGLRALCKMLDEGGCQHLEELDLSSNRLGERSVRDLAEWFHNGAGRPSLRRLLLGDNQVSGLSFVDHPFVGPAKCSLTALNLERNLLGDCDMEPIVKAFIGPTLRQLSLARNYDLGGQALAAASLGRILQEHPHIELLDLMACGRYRHFDVKVEFRDPEPSPSQSSASQHLSPP